MLTHLATSVTYVYVLVSDQLGTLSVEGDPQDNEMHSHKIGAVCVCK